MIKLKSRLSLLFLFMITLSMAQEPFPGVNYTAVYRDNTGQIIANTSLDVRIRVQIDNGSILIWEEDHSVNTDGFGHFQCIIGYGNTTGNGLVNDFESINWGVSTYTISVAIDEGSGFVDFVDNQLYSVPYAFYAKTAENQLYLANLADVDTSGISNGDVLKWDGANWIVHTLSDTIAFSTNSIMAIQSTYSDTANVANALITLPTVDTSLYAYYGDSSNYALNAIEANQTNTSLYSDTADFALEALNVWTNGGNDLDGSAGSIGSLDSTDVVIISNQTSRMRIKADGKIGVGTDTPNADFHIVSDIGFLAEGDFGSGSFPISGAGTRMLWIPKKAALRVGRVNGNKWDEQNIGDYSFAGGFDTRAKGDYSFAFGQSSTSNGNHATAMGYASQAQGNTSVAMGSVSIASGVSSVSLGRGTEASDSASFAIGYHSESHGKASGAFGFYSIVNEDFSYVFGHRARANHSGCFVFSDASTYGGTSAYTTTTADNQFLVKASGGTYFYSDEDLTSGVFLASGSGSWSSLSDKNSKENIEEVNYIEVLNKLDQIDVYSWNYITQKDDLRHIGPFAQDIYNTFKYGETDKAISIVDMDGINLASLKAIVLKMDKLNAEIETNIAYKAKYFELLESFNLLESRISELESTIE